METEDKAEHVLLVVWRYLRGYGAQVATAVSAILLALASLRDFDGTRQTLMWIGLVLGALGILGMVFARPSYAKLLAERNEAMSSARERSRLLERNLTAFLKRLARELEYTNTHYRLSVYCHRDDCFVLLGRHSSHAKWNRVGRPYYRESSDVITDAWHVGRRVVVDLPADKAQRVRNQVEGQGFTEADANGLTMPSRSLVGFRLADGEEPVGVLILESTQPRGVNSRTLDVLPNCAAIGTISTIMAISRDHFPMMVQQLAQSPARERWWRRR